MDDGLSGGLLWTPVAAAYRAAIAARGALYQLGVLQRRRVLARVISVGNIVAGGAGKTPLTIAIAERLLAGGQRVAVLARGYRGRGEYGANVIAPGQGGVADAAVCGDEATLVARRVPQAVVLSGADRVRLAQIAIERFGSQVLLLDDGFQHWQLARDLDIVVLRAPRPFGNSRMLPAGPLREPLAALGRAHVIVVNRSDGPLASPLPAGLTALPRVEIENQTTALVSLVGGETLPLEHLRGARVLIAAGVARPQSVVDAVRGLGAEVAETAVRADHHAWSADEVATLAHRAHHLGALLVTTEKDAVKWVQPPAGTLALRIATRFVSGEDALWRKVAASG